MSDNGPLWRRYLLEEADFVYVGENATVTQESRTEATFDPRVFWGVNGFILFLVTSMCVWCWCFGGKHHLVDWTARRVDSDRRFQQTMRERHEQRMAARRSTPAKRKFRLKRSFQRNKVQMVSTRGRSRSMLYLGMRLRELIISSRLNYIMASDCQGRRYC